MPRTFLANLAAGLLLILLAGPAQAVGLRDVIHALETPFQAATPAGQRIQDYSAEFFQESRIASLDRLQRARGRVSVRFDYRRSGQVPTVMFHWEYEEPTTQEIVSDGKTLWVYLPENNQVIQSDIEQVSRAGENNPMTFLTGLGNLSRDFQISFAEPNRDLEGNYVLDLRPRRTTALLNRMVIVVDHDALAAPAAAGFEDELPSAASSRTRRDKAPAEIEPSSRRSDVPEIERPGRAPRPGSIDFDDEPPGRAARPGSVTLGPEPRGGQAFPMLSTTVYDPSGNSTTIEFSDLRLNRGISSNQFKFVLPAGVEVVRPTGKEMGL